MAHKLFHGTLAEHVPSIKAHGLIPKGSDGADKLYPAQAYNEHDYPWRAKSVYVTPDKTLAEAFADYVRRGFKKPAVVLHIEVPEAHADALQADERSDFNEPCYRYVGTIPPAWIKSVEPATEVPFDKRIGTIGDNLSQLLAQFGLEGLVT